MLYTKLITNGIKTFKDQSYRTPNVKSKTLPIIMFWKYILTSKYYSVTKKFHLSNHGSMTRNASVFDVLDYAIVHNHTQNFASKYYTKCRCFAKLSFLYNNKVHHNTTEFLLPTPIYLLWKTSFATQLVYEVIKSHITVISQASDVKEKLVCTKQLTQLKYALKETFKTRSIYQFIL